MQHTRLLAAAVAAALAVASAAAIAQSGAAPRPAIDANGDGAIDRAEAARAPRLAAQFDRLDRNRDGRLTADERPRMHGMRHRGMARAHAGLRAADTDRDGRISRAEANAAQARAGERFDALDFNKDGYLDRADATARIAQRRGECFTRADSDRNGQLSRAEFDRMGEACAGMRQGMGKRLQRGDATSVPLPARR